MYGIRIFAHTYDIRLSNLTIKNSSNLASLASRPYPALTLERNLDAAGLCIGEEALANGSSGFMGPYFFMVNDNQAQNRVSQVIINNVSCLNSFAFGIRVGNITDIY